MQFHFEFIKYFCLFSSATRVAFKSYSDRLKAGQSQGVAVNNTALELSKAAELHGRVYVASNFYEEVVNSPDKASRSPQFQKVLENMLELHLIQTFFRHLGDILRVS